MSNKDKLKKQRIDELKSKYKVTDDSLINVGSQYILSHFSILNRNREGNQERLDRLNEIIRQNNHNYQFVKSVRLDFDDLLDIYDVSKNIDLSSINEILGSHRHYTEQDYICKLDNGCTVQLTLVEKKDKIDAGEMYLEVENKKIQFSPGIVYGIGRDCENAIAIDDDTISRKHCKIWIDNKKVMLCDLGSTNGTYVNGEQVEETINIKAGDVIRVGKVNCLLKKNTKGRK